MRIPVPKGYQIDYKNCSDEEVVFKPKSDVVTNVDEALHYLSEVRGLKNIFMPTEYGRVQSVSIEVPSLPYKALLCTTMNQAEAIICLTRLLLYRDAANGGWTPDYKSGSTYWAIVWDAEIENVRLTTTPFPHILTFECPKIASKFLEKHREAIRSFFSLIPGVF